jgi:hypothetical protein
MLTQDTIKRLAALAKVSVEDLTAAITSTEETAVTINEKLVAFTDTEIETLKDNTYKDGKKAGVEMSVKEIKEKQGLEFQGKTIEGLLEAATKKALDDAKLTPDKQVTELSEKVKTLQATVQTYENRIAEKDAEVNTIKTKTELYKHIPELEGLALGKDDVIQLMAANGYQYKLQDGKLVMEKDGKVMQDNVANPLPAQDVVTSFLKEKKLISDQPPAPGGRGAGDRKPAAGNAVKMSELKEQFTSQGKSLQGEEFNNAVQKAVADNKDFDLYG